jgi:hypothetical protein
MHLSDKLFPYNIIGTLLVVGFLFYQMQSKSTLVSTEKDIGMKARVMLAALILVQLFMLMTYLVHHWNGMRPFEHEASEILVVSYMVLLFIGIYRGKNPTTAAVATSMAITLLALGASQALFRR